MKILLAVDGSAYTKKMLAYLAAHDELLGQADRLAENDAPVTGGIFPGRRRSLVPNESEGGKPAASPGSTLFERMANLSRGVKPGADEDEDDEAGGSAISIPRFLGRQNNQ